LVALIGDPNYKSSFLLLSRARMSKGRGIGVARQLRTLGRTKRRAMD
jgi:hypothetical protein